MTDGAVPRLLFAAAAATAAVVLLVLAHPLTFFYDEWDFLLERREWTADAFLDPHNEHISILPVALYKLLVTAFGMDSQLPFQVVLTAIAIANAVLVFVWVRRRVGDWLALAATVPLLFLGSSALNLLWPFQITLMGSLAFGLGALVALDRGDRTGDRLACALLVGSVLTHSPGLAFIAGVAAGVLARPDRRARAYVFCIPLAVYLLWWIGWGVGPAGGLDLGRVAHAPIFVLNGFASSIASLLGVVVGLDGDPIDPLRWGRPLLAIAGALAAWRLWRLRRVTPALATVLGTGIAFWLLTALAGGFGREPTNGRYQYLGAVFVILIAAELWRGARPARGAVVIGLAISAVAVAGNLRAFEDQQGFLEGGGEVTRGRLGAVEMAGTLADPQATPVLGVTVAPYLEAVGEYGSPAYDGAELADAGEQAREAADDEFADLYGLTARPAAGAPDRRRCVTAAPGTPATVALAPGGAVVEPRGAAALALRRYATGFPVLLGDAAAGRPVAIEIPPDGASVPWTLAVTSGAPARVCELGTAPAAAG